MPKVTKTQRVGEASVTYQFDSFEDFRQYEAQLNCTELNYTNAELTTSEQNKEFLVAMSKEEIDKVRILLGNVVGDKVCSNLHEYLDEIVGNYIECDEYDTLVYQCIDSVTGEVKQWHNGFEEMSIVFKEKE